MSWRPIDTIREPGPALVRRTVPTPQPSEPILEIIKHRHGTWRYLDGQVANLLGWDEWCPIP